MVNILTTCSSLRGVIKYNGEVMEVTMSVAIWSTVPEYTVASYRSQGRWSGWYCSTWIYKDGNFWFCYRNQSMFKVRGVKHVTTLIARRQLIRGILISEV